MKPRKFTFKTNRPTGPYKSFYNDSIEIKYKRKVCGAIIKASCSTGYQIRLMTKKDDIANSSNPNCDWEWICFKKVFKSIDEAKEWINEKIDYVFEKFTLELQE